jgi:hypothetical protein
VDETCRRGSTVCFRVPLQLPDQHRARELRLDEWRLNQKLWGASSLLDLALAMVLLKKRVGDDGGTCSTGVYALLLSWRLGVWIGASSRILGLLHSVGTGCSLMVGLLTWGGRLSASKALG